ncbi:MAG: TrmH family RNA methyltransferase [Candidatus Paceibacterota bacterium]
MKKIDSILILPDIRSAINIGAIFRTADAVGISKIYLTGYTPRPTDKFGRIQKDIAKSALGAETWIPWKYKKTLVPLINILKKKGYKIIAIEQDERAIDYRKISAQGGPSLGGKSRIVIIMGPEVLGLDKKILDKCDIIAQIPMHGKKESLNVSVACGVALFRILKP